MKIDTSSIVFLGDSLTEWFDLDKHFPDRDLINEGVAGDTTHGVLYRLRDVTSGHPAKILLMIGLNDLFQGMKPKEITLNHEDILVTIRDRSPGTTLVVQSILPVNEDMIMGSGINKKIQKLNRSLKKMCRHYKHTYVDLFVSFLDGKQLRKEYTYDGGHLTEKGYSHWASLIRDYL